MTPQTPLASRVAQVFPGGSLGALRLPSEYEFVVERASGCRLYTDGGRTLIDHVLGSGPVILGHGHPAVTAAIAAQVEQGTTYYYMNRPAVELAEVLIDALPCAEKVRFMSGGTEATYLALRLARAYTGRPKVLKFEGGFHGFHDVAMVSLAPNAAAAFPRGQASSAGMSPSTLDEVLVVPYNDIEATRQTIAAHAHELAAVIVEPIQRDIAPLPGFLSALRELCTRHGVVLIFDEMVTGFRLAYGGYQNLCGVTPDLCTLGKIIGGGLPLSAVCGRAELLDTASTGAPAAYVSGTLSGNPVGAAAGLATLAVLREPGSYERLHQIGERMRQGIARAGAAAGLPVQVVGEGPMWNVYFVTEPIVDYRSTRRDDGGLQAQFFRHLLARGIFVNPGKKSYLSLAHDDEALTESLVAVEQSMVELAALRNAALK